MGQEQREQGGRMADREKQLVRLLMEKTDNTTEISDRELSSSDKQNMIRHGELYTRLLSIYVEHAEQTLRAKRRFKKEFYGLCEHILRISCGVFLCMVFLMMTGVVSMADPVALIGTFVSFLTVFIVIPQLITKYLFNLEEEKYMTDIIKSVQDHDVKIREKM